MAKSKKERPSQANVSDFPLGSVRQGLSEHAAPFWTALSIKIDEKSIWEKSSSRNPWDSIELIYFALFLRGFPSLREEFNDILKKCINRNEELFREIDGEIGDREHNIIARGGLLLHLLQESDYYFANLISRYKRELKEDKGHAGDLGTVFEGTLNREFAIEALKLAEKESPYPSQRKFIESLGVSRNVYRQCIEGKASIDQICEMLEKAGRPLRASLPPSEPN